MPRSPNFPSLVPVLFWIGILLFSAPVAGGPIATFGTSASAGTGVNCPVQSEFNTGPFESGAQAGCNDVVGNTFADVRGVAESGLGMLRSEAILNSLGYPASNANASSAFFDTLVVSAPLPPGTVGQLLVRMPYSGLLATDLVGGTVAPFVLPTAQVNLDVQVQSPRGSFQRDLGATQILESQEGLGNGVIVLPIEFVFGQPFRVSALLLTFVQTQIAEPVQSAFALSRYGSTAWWLGVENVRLQSGLPVLEFEVSSESGIDYGADTDESSFELLHGGGDFVTHPGQAAGGASASMVGSDWAFLGFNVLQNPGGNGERRVADRFVLVEERTVQRVVTYAYESNIQTPTWTGFNMNIWDGRPGDGGSQILATTQMAAFDSTGIYRVPSGAASLPNTARPVYAIEWFLDPLSLPAGEYWIDWQVEGGSSAFAVPTMAINPDEPNDPITVSGLARHLAPAGWQDFGAPTRSLATPFQVLGPSDTNLIFSDGFE